MLVLEFMEGGDLWSALRGPHREELQWYGRGRSLALDIARGLHFLHEHKARLCFRCYVACHMFNIDRVDTVETAYTLQAAAGGREEQRYTSGAEGGEEAYECDKRDTRRGCWDCMDDSHVPLQVVHADMKTKNILLSAGRMTAKIADVGLARYMAQTHMDTKSLPMGTFVYAAPELLLGRRSDHKAST